MAAFDVKATIVAAVFMVVGGVAGAFIASIPAFFTAWSGEPKWLYRLIPFIYAALIVGGVVGGVVLGWWLATS